ncbi:MAG: hypothetical protein RIR26_903 [Pseudomonadota bacterium]
MTELIPQRVELFHPIFIHFPIALLLSAALARVILWVLDRRQFRFKWITSARTHLRTVFLWSWVLGCLGLVGAYFSGDIAEGVVNRIICDPTVTHDHEDFAVATMVAAGSTLLLSVVHMFARQRVARVKEVSSSQTFTRLEAFSKYCHFFEFMALFLTLGFLIWTSHLGGSLVYEQGAGFLKNPNELCGDEADEMTMDDEVTSGGQRL